MSILFILALAPVFVVGNSNNLRATEARLFGYTETFGTFSSSVEFILTYDCFSDNPSFPPLVTSNFVSPRSVIGSHEVVIVGCFRILDSLALLTLLSYIWILV
jgi:hypothetical protein